MAYVLTYTNGFGDYVAMIRAKRSIGPMGAFGPFTPYIVVSLIYLVITVLGQVWDGVPLSALLEPQSLLIILAGVPLVMIFVALIDLLFTQGLYRLVFKRFVLANAELTVRLDDSGIQWSGNDFAGSCQWSKVERVVETKDRIFLFVSKIEGLILPRRALASDQAFDGLKAYVRSHLHD